MKIIEGCVISSAESASMLNTNLDLHGPLRTSKNLSRISINSVIKIRKEWKRRGFSASLPHGTGFPVPNEM